MEIYCIFIVDLLSRFIMRLPGGESDVSGADHSLGSKDFYILTRAPTDKSRVIRAPAPLVSRLAAWNRGKCTREKVLSSCLGQVSSDFNNQLIGALFAHALNNETRKKDRRAFLIDRLIFACWKYCVLRRKKKKRTLDESLILSSKMTNCGNVYAEKMRRYRLILHTIFPHVASCCV